LFGSGGNKSEFYERRECRDLCAEEIKATLDLVWGGSGAVEKRYWYWSARHHRHSRIASGHSQKGTFAINRLRVDLFLTRT
jgi:hypothetical protein